MLSGSAVAANGLADHLEGLPVIGLVSCLDQNRMDSQAEQVSLSMACCLGAQQSRTGRHCSAAS